MYATTIHAPKPKPPWSGFSIGQLVRDRARCVEGIISLDYGTGYFEVLDTRVGLSSFCHFSNMEHMCVGLKECDEFFLVKE